MSLTVKPLRDTVMASADLARYVVVLGLSTLFLYALVNAFYKWSEGKISETQMVEKKSPLLFPSVTICPVFRHKGNNVTGSKNLTEYYSSMASIDDYIINLQHAIETEKGQVYLTIPNDINEMSLLPRHFSGLGIST